METATVRVRSLVWFATGVVVTLLATLIVLQAWRVDASPGDVDATFVPMAGCRLMDTRPEPDRVGTKGTLSTAETTTLQATGSNGNCLIPADAVGLSMNVTALNATANGFLTFWPGGLRPLAASLNPAPGQPPVPNAVTVSLSGSGSFNVYNENGTVDMVIDVNGYYTKTSLTELATRLAAVEAAQAAGVDPAVLANIATNTSGVATNASGVATNISNIATNSANIATLDDREPFAVTARDVSDTVTETDESVVSVTVTAPAAGQVTVNSTTRTFANSGGDNVRCSITTASTPAAFDFDYEQEWESAGTNGQRAQLSGTRMFDIAAGEIATYALVCDNIDAGGSTSSLFDSVLTAIFTPAP